MAERTRRRATSGTTRRRSAASEEGRLNRDYSEEEYREPGEGYNGEQPTKGLYTCELISISDHTKQDDPDAKSVKWMFRLVEGSENKHGDDVSGFVDAIYTTENTAWREQQILVATGVIKPKGKVNLPYDGIVKKAKPCTVRMGVERYIPEDGDPEWRGRMQAFLPPKDVTTTRRRRKDEDEPVEDVFEDQEDGDEDDGDDEPETPPPSRRRSRKADEPEPEPEDDEDEEEDDEPDEPYDPDELAAELEDLSLAALKKRAREEFGVKIARGMDADAIIDAVIDTLDEDDEEEEPPPPPKRASRASAKTTTRRKARGSSEPPPF